MVGDFFSGMIEAMGFFGGIIVGAVLGVLLSWIWRRYYKI